MKVEKPKIAYILPRFYPFKGGAEVHFYSLASRMVNKGYDITVITTDVKFRNEELPKEEIYNGIKIVRLHSWNESLYAGFYPSLLTYLFKNQFEIIHSSGIGFLWREFCLILLKLFKRKTKLIVTPHGPFMALNDKEGFRGFSKKAYTFILRMFLNSLYNIVIQVNPSQEDWLVKEYNINKEKLRLVPNGIDENYLEKSIVEHNKSEPVVITSVGRMEWYKGHQDIVKALGVLKDSKEKLVDFELKILGRAGNYTEKLKNLISELNLDDKVTLIYSPTDEERDNILFNQSQINILASKWEAAGIVLLESMAKGNVVVTTNTNEGAPMFIKNNRNGFLYNFGDYHRLASILEKLLQDKDLRDGMREKNLNIVKDFTWEGILPSYIDIIKEIHK